MADIANAPPMHLTMRRDFDEMLHAEALAKGVAPYLGSPADAIDEAAKTITIKGGDTLGYTVLIAADGVNSFVARTLYGRAFDPEKVAFGLEIETPLPPNRDGAVEIDFDAAHWGYGWSFPKRVSETVGVCGVNGRNPDMKANMAAFVDQVGGDMSLKYKGQYLPFGDYRKNPGRGAILLAGDAAGLVDPITGEGIALAMESGTHAAEAAVEALKHNPDAAFSLYKRRVRHIQKDLDQARMWRLIMFPKATEGYFKKAFAKGSHLQIRYLDMLAGDATYGDLRGALIKRIPKLIWRMAKHKMGFRPPR